jgi:hypothetical protein
MTLRITALRIFACLLLLVLMLSPVGSVMASPQHASTGKPCDQPAYRQFDFWIGDWNAYDIATGKKDAHVKVERILDGCVLHEDYQATNGHQGQSFSIYDASRKLWHQTWVTNDGRLLEIEGTFTDGEMVLTGTDLTSDGRQQQARGIWKPVKGAVRETGTTSLDGGKTWQPWFDLIFRPS